MEDLSTPEPSRLDALGARAAAGEKISRRERRELETYLLLRCLTELEHICDAASQTTHAHQPGELASVADIREDSP